ALVTDIRENADSSMMELFLGEYGLSSDEGIALMCLAEALLRVPDTETIDDLIEDKIVGSAWSAHLGQSHSPLINASTWALMLTGRVLDDEGTGIVMNLRKLVKRMGEPVIRTAVARAMREMGKQFVLGETITSAMKRAKAMEEKGYTYSYDMLGEAALTEADAKRYHIAYANAISEIATAADGDSIAENPGISIKLSALHPRYEPLQRDRLLVELVPRVISLMTLAKSAGVGLNIDAEEADRLDLSLDIIDALFEDQIMAGWDGFGVVVQAYSKRAGFVIDWLNDRTTAHDRKIMVRLVKGAYWDAEIKHAQVEGLPGYPVFTQKAATDGSYLACSRKLFDYADRIYPQFATHNAATVAALLDMAPDGVPYEFQRLHGMGEALYDIVMKQTDARCRIYAPVGAHKDLLAYLVRRLLENGANSSFVNQITDLDVPADAIAADPIITASKVSHAIGLPAELFAPERENSHGFDVADPDELAQIVALRDAATDFSNTSTGGNHIVRSPSTGTQIGTVTFTTADAANDILNDLSPWAATATDRAETLRAVANLYEEHAPELFGLLAHEAGKTINDCIGELREAVDFLRYYAAQAEVQPISPLGTVACISPWNFPLAIFTGQIAAALAAGNAIAAKPAEATNLIALRAVDLMYRAGVPKTALALLCGEGPILGPVLCSHPKTSGVVFTGSTPTGRAIHRMMAEHLPPETPLIAETGGINAMIVDSSALLEQAVNDIMMSAFQSAGQRCSALRVLYVQSDVAEALQTMLFGAMDTLNIGHPALPSVDIGPVIDARAKQKIDNYIADHATKGSLLKQVAAPNDGTFVGPAVIKVDGIADVAEEIFGPVLHIATFEADQLPDVVEDINVTGYALTFGLHTRIDNRVQDVVEQITAGNIYVNRNQIGAVVGSQPFGGYGLSGTGPKAGGPRYLVAMGKAVQTAPSFQCEMPGPTGETNTYSIIPRHNILCVGPGKEVAAKQAKAARALGCQNVTEAPDATPANVVAEANLSVVIYAGQPNKAWRIACANRDGQLCKLVTSQDLTTALTAEKLVCIDTTASGGNAELLANN
ncbi:MAG: bifunctional proline dehydrogenase/L-glutamate gamma-semialdehyde dehydrogenase PutA, partial [Planktomarina sp.]